MKESEKLNKYLNVVRELKKLWNMKVAMVPIIEIQWTGDERENQSYPDHNITKVSWDN